MSRRRRSGLRAALLPRAIGITRLLPTPVILGLRPLLARSLQFAPGLRRRVKQAMIAGLGAEAVTDRQVTDYFRRIADLVAYSAAVYRSGLDRSGLEGQWERDPGWVRMPRVLEAGKGALMVCPHLTGHEIMAGSAAADLPITFLVRKSPDPAYEALKQRWYAALGVEVAYRPPAGGQFQGLGEMTAALRALKKNRVLALTPDLLQRPGTGIPVRFLGREARLPAGAFFLAARTGAPLVPVFFRKEGPRYRLWAEEPLEIGGGEPDAAIAAAAQAWAALFEAFLRENPEMWQFWLDKKWAGWLGV